MFCICCLFCLLMKYVTYVLYLLSILFTNEIFNVCSVFVVYSFTNLLFINEMWFLGKRFLLLATSKGIDKNWLLYYRAYFWDNIRGLHSKRDKGYKYWGTTNYFRCIFPAHLVFFLPILYLYPYICATYNAVIVLIIMHMCTSMHVCIHAMQCNAMQCNESNAMLWSAWSACSALYAPMCSCLCIFMHIRKRRRVYSFVRMRARVCIHHRSIHKVYMFRWEKHFWQRIQWEGEPLNR